MRKISSRSGSGRKGSKAILCQSDHQQDVDGPLVLKLFVSVIRPHIVKQGNGFCDDCMATCHNRPSSVPTRIKIVHTKNRYPRLLSKEWWVFFAT